MFIKCKCGNILCKIQNDVAISKRHGRTVIVNLKCGYIKIVCERCDTANKITKEGVKND